MHLPNTAMLDLKQQLQACQSKSRRNGKVARLPSQLRDKINRMLKDGFEYKIIIQKLGEAGRHLNEDNITNWRRGGYQDYLNGHAINERACAQTQAAADLLRDEGHLDPELVRAVCQELAALQYLSTLMEHGDRVAQDSLKRNPAKMITLMNTLCKMANAGRLIEQSKSLQGLPKKL